MTDGGSSTTDMEQLVSPAVFGQGVPTPERFDELRRTYSILCEMKSTPEERRLKQLFEDAQFLKRRVEEIQKTNGCPESWDLGEELSSQRRHTQSGDEDTGRDRSKRKISTELPTGFENKTTEELEKYLESLTREADELERRKQRIIQLKSELVRLKAKKSKSENKTRKARMVTDVLTQEHDNCKKLEAQVEVLQKILDSPQQIWDVGDLEDEEDFIDSRKKRGIDSMTGQYRDLRQTKEAALALFFWSETVVGLGIGNEEEEEIGAEEGDKKDNTPVV